VEYENQEGNQLTQVYQDKYECTIDQELADAAAQRQGLDTLCTHSAAGSTFSS